MRLSRAVITSTAALLVAVGSVGVAAASPAEASRDDPSITLTSSMTVDAPSADGSAGVTYQLTLSGHTPHIEGPSTFIVQCSSGLDAGTVVSKPVNWDTLECPNDRLQIADLDSIPPGGSQTLVMHFAVTDTSRPAEITVVPTRPNSSCTIANSDSAPLTIVSNAPPAGHIGVPYSFTVADSRFTPSAYGSTGLMAAGLTIDPSTGHIRGTPTAPGLYPVTLTSHSSTWGEADATATYNLKITGDAPTFTTTALVSGGLAESYSDAITASGSPQFSITAGLLPPGLLMNKTTGLVSGVPLSAGVYRFAVTATNISGSSVQQFQIEVTGGGGEEM